MTNINEITVQKKDGQLRDWNPEKILQAVGKSSARSEEPITKEQQKYLIKNVEEIVVEKMAQKSMDIITTADLHLIVMEVLRVINYSVYSQYSSYREYTTGLAEILIEAKDNSEGIVYVGMKENASKDSAINSCKHVLIGESVMATLMKTFEILPTWKNAHDDGWIHIHDISQRYLRQINCCLFDMAGLLKGGFELNGAHIIEPKGVDSALSLIGDVTLQASAQQYGGFTINELDSVLAPYAEKTYLKELQANLSYGIESGLASKMAYDRTIREIEQHYQGFETKLNTVSNALGQIPFVTVTMGLNSSKWGREITKIMLKVRGEGLGETKITAIFPKLVMMYREDIMGPGKVNEDIFELGVECSRTRLYPDWLSLDGAENPLREVYDRSGLAVGPMGCRAFLSRNKEGREVYNGRMNIGAVTLNLPKMAIEANGDVKEFYRLIDKYSEMVFAIHEDYYEKSGKMKGSTNPLLFCEGGAFKSVGYDENIKAIIEEATASLGYVGIEEACQSLFGSSIRSNQEFALELVSYLRAKTETAKRDFNHLYALYSTPAESLCFRFNELNRKSYGQIENVTSNDYMTNSFHVHVKEDISVPEKIAFEAPFHRIATGGRISYTEFAFGVDSLVLQQAIRFAMKEGMYYGINMVSSTCSDCGYQGDYHDNCPQCNSRNVIEVERVCGYLSYGNIKGDTRFNPGKQAEVKDRVKHKTGNLLGGI